MGEFRTTRLSLRVLEEDIGYSIPIDWEGDWGATCLFRYLKGPMDLLNLDTVDSLPLYILTLPTLGA